jgi:outer membrane protein assembly factor BamE (lipoprotein component of BamABCDE complex)
MRVKIAVSVVLFAAVCSGCTTIRESYTSMREGFASWREAFWRDAFEDPARVDKITAGVMTRQQVRELLGEPHLQSSLNGEERWTYKSYRPLPKSYVPLTNAKSGSMQSLAVYIEFNRDGIVKKLDTEKQQW